MELGRGGCKKNLGKKQKPEKFGVGVKKFGGKNPKNGKKTGVGVILD